MNKLQTFLARADILDRPNKQEQFTIGTGPTAVTFYATIDRAQVTAEMLRQGYNDWADATITAGAVQFVTAPTPRQAIVRVATSRTYWIQSVDSSDPVLYTINLVDRDPN